MLNPIFLLDIALKTGYTYTSLMRAITSCLVCAFSLALCGVGSSAYAADDASVVSSNLPDDKKTVQIIKSLKKVSGTPDEDAKAYAFIVMSEFFVSDMFSGIAVHEKPEKHYRKTGVVKQIQALQKKKDVETILAVEEGANMKAVRTKLMKWFGIKAPIVQWNMMNLSEIADCDGVYVVDCQAKCISQGMLEDAESLAEMLDTLNTWLENQPK